MAKDVEYVFNSKFVFFAMGDSSYPKFNWVGLAMARRLQDWVLLVSFFFKSFSIEFFHKLFSSFPHECYVIRLSITFSNYPMIVLSFSIITIICYEAFCSFIRDKAQINLLILKWLIGDN